MAMLPEMTQHLEYLRRVSALRSETISAAARHDVTALNEAQGRWHEHYAMRKKPTYKSLLGGPYIDQADQIVPSPVFYVAEYHHKRHGQLLVAALGTHTSAQMATVRYDWLAVSKVADGPEVFTIYAPCGSCRTLESGKAHTSCTVCQGAGWERRNGKPTAPFGTPVAVLSVLRPTAPEHRAHYDALIAGEPRERT